MRVKLIEYAGQGGADVPVTFGIGCGEGDFAKGQLCPEAGGRPIPAQVDVLATWPRDGSIRHALVSMVLPRIGANGSLELAFRKAAPPAPQPFRMAAGLGEMVIRAELTGADGTAAVSRIPPETLARMAEILAGRARPGELAPRLAGPICYEFEVHDVPDLGGKPDPDIDVFYRLRLYSGREGIRVAWVVENTRLPRQSVPGGMAIADREFTRLRFQAGRRGAVRDVYTHQAVTQYYGTRYRVLGWIGAEPPAVYAKQSLPYLTYAQFFPKLDLSHPVTAAQAAQALQNQKQRGYDPARAPLGRILHHNHVHRHMPGTGGRPDIGAQAQWHRLALASESPALHLSALAAEGNSVASFPIHRRQRGTLAPGAPYDDKIHPVFWDSVSRGRHSDITYRRSKTPCPQTPDYAHTPSAAYYGYLTTGERFFEEELAFWAMYPSYTWPHKGLLPGTTRAKAWQLRNVTDAAFLLPDGHPRKGCLQEFVQRNLSHLAAELAKRGHLFLEPSRKCSGRLHYVCSRQVSTWMYCWLVWSLDNAARKGFPRAAGIRDGAADILLRLYEGKEEFKAPNGKVYRFDPNHAMAYQVAVDLVQVEFLDGGQERDTVLRAITVNTGMMYYYTLVNDANKYWFPQGQAYEAWKRALPRKVMRPDDWPLDEAQARKKGGRLPHEYGNAECSAALARYANPRAHAMYELVRKTMAEKKGRIRGIEYVK